MIRLPLAKLDRWLAKRDPLDRGLAKLSDRWKLNRAERLAHYEKRVTGLEAEQLKIRDLHANVEAGKISPEDALEELKLLKGNGASSAELSETIGEASERIRGIREEAAETMTQTRADANVKIAEAKANAEVAKIQRESEREVERLNKQYAKEDKKPKLTAKNIAIGGGIAAGGVAGYNMLTGGAANNAGTYAEAENAGSQAAIRDAMQEGYGPVMMGAPMPQVQAANLNYEGLMQGEQLQASR